MPEVFFISDTHFGHAKIAEARGFSSVEEHDTYLADAWNRVVRSRDVIYHLGDVSLGNREILASLKGYKKLVLGNHDNWNVLAPYFDRCYGAVAFRSSILTHVPIAMSALGNRFSFNVHGHTHSFLQGDRYVNVCVEQLPGGNPIALPDLLRRYEL